jgi:hypothetical protein
MERWRKRETHPIRNGSAHTRNEHNAPPIPKPDHLFCGCLCSHKDPGDVDAQHLVTISRGVLQGWRLLLNAGGSNQTIQALVLIRNLLHNGIHSVDIADIDALVGERGAQLLDSSGLHPGEVRRRLF